MPWDTFFMDKWGLLYLVVILEDTFIEMMMRRRGTLDPIKPNPNDL
jgi:hypothetical protein